MKHWIETIKGKTVITTEEETKPAREAFLFWKAKPPVIKMRKFVAAEQIVGNYYRWLEMPDNMIVGDSLSFQLDAWKANG